MCETLLVVLYDASEEACAVITYIYVTSTDGCVICHLVIAKTRLVPLRLISIPRGGVDGMPTSNQTREDSMSGVRV